MLYAEKREGQHFDNTPEGYAKLHTWITRRLSAQDIHICL
jgi:hypothetical protein